jgi:hypothetical protein
MKIYDDIFTWDGWGGKMRLASGSCQLRIYDQKQAQRGSATILRPIIVVVSDIPEQTLSIRSCAGHIATVVTHKFNIDPHRMMWVEHYPATEYGVRNVHIIPERFDLVEFAWHEGRAVNPHWRALKPPLLDSIKEVMGQAS